MSEAQDASSAAQGSRARDSLTASRSTTAFQVVVIHGTPYSHIAVPGAIFVLLQLCLFQRGNLPCHPAVLSY